MPTTKPGKSNANQNKGRILVLHGPNLNMLGQREVDIYGDTTLDEINQMLEKIAEHHQFEVICFQSNHEGALIDKIHESVDTTDGIIINPAALTHTSVALRDALALYPNEVVEVHLSNIHNREDFRKESLVAPVVTGTISGFGIDSYRLAMLWMINHLEREE